MNINIYYFSGTGNTYIVIKHLAKVLKNYNCNVTTKRIENVGPENIDLNSTIGLAFPVAMQGTYPLVWDFIEKLPKSANNTPIFMIDTLHMFSGGIVGPVKKILKNKGYNPIGAIEVIMPSNFFVKKVNDKKNINIIKKSFLRLDLFAEKLTTEKTNWIRIPILSDFTSIFSKKKVFWKFYRKMFNLVINKNKCNNCGLCIQLCPVNNIKKNDYPEILNNCNLCMRCITFCPQQAISTKNGMINLYYAVKLNEIVHNN